MGKTNGYEYLKDLRELKEHPKTPVFDFGLPDGRFLRSFLPGETGEVFFGVGTGTRTTEKVPFVLRRRRGIRATFLAVYDYSGDGTAVRNVDILRVHDRTGAIRTDAVGLEIVDAAGGKTLIGLDLSGKNIVSKRFLGKIPFEHVLFEKSARSAE